MFQFAYLYNQASLKEIADYYVQGQEYFQESSDAIKQMFQDGIGDPIDMVAIHVRRGDYVNNPFYVDLFEDGYYERAMTEFHDAKFLVFSDDIRWCRKQNIFKGCEFSKGKTPEQDMNLMAACRGIIIANSSFSWWAAFISPYAEQIVAPKEWYTDRVERTSVPREWLRV